MTYQDGMLPHLEEIEKKSIWYDLSTSLKSDLAEGRIIVSTKKLLILAEKITEELYPGSLYVKLIDLCLNIIFQSSSSSQFCVC